MLTHTAGIVDIRQELLLRERPSYRGMLERICAADLQSTPGERYAYASDSFYLLAETISRLTGMPFGDALRRRLFEPLGMASTTFDPRPMRSRVPPVRGVPLGNPLLRELILRFLAKATLPGGGLFGSAEDLLRLGRALLPRDSGPGPRVLSQTAIEAMTTEQTAGILEIHEDGSTRDPHYALGWRKPDPRGATAGSLGSSGTAGAWAGIAKARSRRPTTARRQHPDRPTTATGRRDAESEPRTRKPRETPRRPTPSCPPRRGPSTTVAPAAPACGSTPSVSSYSSSWPTSGASPTRPCSPRCARSTAPGTPPPEPTRASACGRVWADVCTERMSPTETAESWPATARCTARNRSPPLVAGGSGPDLARGAPNGTDSNDAGAGSPAAEPSSTESVPTHA